MEKAKRGNKPKGILNKEVETQNERERGKTKQGAKKERGWALKKKTFNVLTKPTNPGCCSATQPPFDTDSPNHPVVKTWATHGISEGSFSLSLH